MKEIKLQVLDGDFSICQVEELSQADFSGAFCFVAKTDEEISLVCPEERVPKNEIGRAHV